MLIPLNEIERARERLEPYLKPSPVHYAQNYSTRLSAEVFFKLELLLPTHVFKVRGALNAVLAMPEAERAKGVITASGGNHGLGLTYAAKQVGAKATVIVPKSTPQIRIDTIRELGGEVTVQGEDWNAANTYALELVEQKGYTYVSPFDHPDIIAGQGTVGLEVLEQVPDVDLIVCSVGGGGLISGIASAVKQVRPEVRVVGVETLGADCMSQSLKAGHLVELPKFSSIAESLGTKRSTERPFAIIQEAVEEVVTVSDEAAVRELLYTLNFEKLLSEPATSCSLAALCDGHIPDVEGRTIVPIICGGNIKLDNVIEWQKRFGLEKMAVSAG